MSSMQSIDSELGGMVRDSSMDSRLDSRLSGGSTQSDIPRGPRKKKKGLMGKLRSLTKSGRNSESEISVDYHCLKKFTNFQLNFALLVDSRI